MFLYRQADLLNLQGHSTVSQFMYTLTYLGNMRISAHLRSDPGPAHKKTWFLKKKLFKI